MRRKANLSTWIPVWLMLTAAGLALADDFTLDWWTIDGGGVLSSAGDGFELGGTIGQPDAGAAMTGGGFELTGGFWTAPPCWCFADVNHDGLRDGLDVQSFVDCLLAPGGECACADVAADGVIDLSDVAAFVNELLAGVGCASS